MGTRCQGLLWQPCTLQVVLLSPLHLTCKVVFLGKVYAHATLSPGLGRTSCWEQSLEFLGLFLHRWAEGKGLGFVPSLLSPAEATVPLVVGPWQRAQRTGKVLFQVLY